MDSGKMERKHKTPFRFYILKHKNLIFDPWKQTDKKKLELYFKMI